MTAPAEATPRRGLFPSARIPAPTGGVYLPNPRALSVTCGDSSPKGRAKAVSSKRMQNCMRKAFPLRGRWQPEGLTDEVLRQWCGAADSPSVSIIGLRTESLVGAPLPGCSKGGNAGGRGRPPLRTYTKRISRRGDPCGRPPEPPPISKPFWTAREGGPYGHIQTALLVRRFTNRPERREQVPRPTSKTTSTDLSF